MSDQPIHTMVDTADGELAFQEYFVHRRCEPQVTGFRFDGIEKALPADGLLEAVKAASAVVICPSNPWVSIDPILAVTGIRAELIRKRDGEGMPIAAVSPIVAGSTIKGPAAKMYRELGIEPSALAVARHYRGLITHFVLDRQDAGLQADVPTLAVDSIMNSAADRRRLAEDVLHFIGR
jgi:LPPG:FO 2-phospho-L-lactate transferase